MLTSFITRDSSLKKTLNKIGPSIEPCGTLKSIHKHPTRGFLKIKRNVKMSRNVLASTHLLKE